MLVLSFVFGNLAAVFFRFRLHSLFVPRNLCVKHYASFCIFMQSKNVYLYNIMINRKLCGYFWGLSSTFAQTSYLFTFCFLAFPSVLIFQTQTETETKNPLFPRFCLKTSLFVANKVLILSNLRLYRANHTPPPRFWHSQGGSALFRKFFIFLFFIFL